MTVPSIDPRELHEICRTCETVDIIDVRTPVEFRELHAQGTRSLPLDQLDAGQLLASRNGRANEPLYFICRSGGRGKKACERLLAAGFTNVINVEGGTLAWEQAGLPVVRGKKSISLERQVRIAAGSLVLVSTVLALLIDPLFALLAAFIGAGLVFAGITDTCGMGMLLAKMPWNQAKETAVSCCSMKGSQS